MLKSVLVVDGDEERRRDLVYALSRRGLRYLDVDDAFAAMGAVGRADFGAIVATESRRTLSLRGLCQLARKHHDGIFVFVLRQSDNDRKDLSALLGVPVDAIEPGTKPDKLAAAVEDALSGRRAGADDDSWNEPTDASRGIDMKSTARSKAAAGPARKTASGAPTSAPTKPEHQPASQSHSDAAAIFDEPTADPSPPPPRKKTPAAAVAAAAPPKASTAAAAVVPRSADTASLPTRKSVAASGAAASSPPEVTVRDPIPAPVASSVAAPTATGSDALVEATPPVPEPIPLFTDSLDALVDPPTAELPMPASWGSGGPAAAALEAVGQHLATAEQASVATARDAKPVVPSNAAPGASASATASAEGSAINPFATDELRPPRDAAAEPVDAEPVDAEPVADIAIDVVVDDLAADLEQQITALVTEPVAEPIAGPEPAAPPAGPPPPLLEGVIDAGMGPGLLLALFAQQLTGRFTLKGSTLAGTLYFYRGDPVWAEDAAGDAGLHRRLVQTHVLPPDANLESVDEGMLLGSLVQAGRLTPQQMHEFMRDFVRDLTLGVITTTSAEYRFDEDLQFLEVAPLFRVNPFGLVFESRRKSVAPAELMATAKELEGKYMVPGPTLAAASEKLAPFVRNARLVDIVDGTRTVGQVLQLAELDPLMGTLVVISLRDTSLVSLEQEPRTAGAGGVTLIERPSAAST